ncbi:hypothetical protein HAX54_030261 [Datura stramonium]|uniref:Uncharacterized protein n=1 Tax=Datura stramonium TaxID=4076 RepID=A0ABS8V7F6_DATST|nr:hypothetical protein [Datura stramonium]
MGKRAYIPCQKTRMDQETRRMIGTSQQGKKTTVEIIEETTLVMVVQRSNGTVIAGIRDKSRVQRKTLSTPRSKGQFTEKQVKNHSMESVKLIWVEVIAASEGKGQTNPMNSGKKSWADQVEEKTEISKGRSSVWDSFDIMKVSYAGFKLEYVPPNL